MSALGSGSEEVSTFHDDVDFSRLNEVHLVAHGALFDDGVSRQEKLSLQLLHEVRDELGSCLREKGHRPHRGSNIVVYNLL